MNHTKRAIILAASGLALMKVSLPLQAQSNRPQDPWARDHEVVVNDKAGAPLLRVQLEFIGHKPPEGYRGMRADPEVVQHDFYRRTLTNLSGQELRFTSNTSKMRYGTGTVMSQNATGGKDTWGSEMKIDIEKNPIVTGNALRPGQKFTTTHFILHTLARQAMEFTLGFEHDGAPYDIGYNLIYLRK